MLEKILKKTDCAICRFCCAFDNTDSWEIPLFDINAVNFIKSKVEDAEFHKVGEMFRLIPRFDKNGLYYCAALSDKGCTLSNELKPFDCKIWPFRVMEKDEKVFLTLSDGCKYINKISENEISSFVDDGFSEKIKAYVSENKEMIKPFIDGYRLIKVI